jgi:nicotinate-nucleotide pyrophosphorylase (carboxylating)
MKRLPVNQEMSIETHWLDEFVARAIREDLGTGDWTSDLLVQSDVQAQGAILAQAEGIVCGVPVAQHVFRWLDSAIQFTQSLADGKPVCPDEPVLTIQGNARAILKGERTALNILQRLSGIATLTRRYVDTIQDTGARIVDTRKTTPHLRRLEKYAVKCGGGLNHRFGLYDGILIKDNHIALMGGDIRQAVERARAGAPHTLRVEVECTTLEQVQQAIEAGADGLLLDNMGLPLLKQAVEAAKEKVQFLEASGGVNLQTVRAIAETGVDLISVGALTHSAPILSMHLEI